jgi:hypothetical protein
MPLAELSQYPFGIHTENYSFSLVLLFWTVLKSLSFLLIVLLVTIFLQYLYEGNKEPMFSFHTQSLKSRQIFGLTHFHKFTIMTWSMHSTSFGGITSNDSMVSTNFIDFYSTVVLNFEGAHIDHVPKWMNILGIFRSTIPGVAPLLPPRWEKWRCLQA